MGKREKLDDITLEDIKEAIYLVMTQPITSVAPLGFCGEDYYLYGNKLTKEEKERTGNWRTSQISFRNYCNMPEMLICDKVGNFLFYGKFDVNDYELVANEYYNIFLKLKDKINIENPIIRISNIDFSNVEYTKGFDMMISYIKSKRLGDD